MGYNCDRFRVKRLENLVIPIKTIYSIEYAPTWEPENPEIIDIESNKIIINFGQQSIEGIAIDDNLHVSKIRMDGEGSGRLMPYVEEFLKQSTGYLEAVRVWERGDTIDRLIVDNGIVATYDIE